MCIAEFMVLPTNNPPNPSPNPNPNPSDYSITGDLIFTKKLSKTDVKHRLAWPTSQVKILTEEKLRGRGIVKLDLNASPGHNLEFRVLEPVGQRSWTLCCRTRQTGPYLKPIISPRGWLAVVRALSLREGDRIAFYTNNDPAISAPFLIRVIHQ